MATAPESAAAQGRLESLSQVAGVLGTQWGDEGKGKLVDILAQRFDIVARCQVGPSRAVARASFAGWGCLVPSHTLPLLANKSCHTLSKVR